MLKSWLSIICISEIDLIQKDKYKMCSYICGDYIVHCVEEWSVKIGERKEPRDRKKLTKGHRVREMELVLVF
jgi:hypothetical protein